MNNEKGQVDNILMSISELNDDNYNEYTDKNSSYSVIEEENIKFAIIPTGTIVHKALPKRVDLKKYLRKYKYAFPSFYTNINIVKKYVHDYFSKTGIVCSYKIFRPIKLLILNDMNNIVKLIELFNENASVQGVLDETRKGAIKELLTITGMNTYCLVERNFKNIEKKTGLTKQDFLLNRKISEIKDDENKRETLYAINMQFVRNVITVLKHFGYDGYISNKLPLATNEISSIYHDENMICLIGDAIKYEYSSDINTRVVSY